MNTPNINLEELKKLKEDNLKDRLEFIEEYAKWVKYNPNSKWSSSQRKIIK